MTDAPNGGAMNDMLVASRTEREEPDGFRAMFLAGFPAVARTVYFIVQDRRLAEEITQEAFIQLLLSWKKVSTYDRPDLWVRRVAVRRAQRERHRERRRPALELRGAGTGGFAPGPEGFDDEVLGAIRALAPKQRAIVVLFYYEDRPMAEIAEIVGCSTSSGWSQLHNARKNLAQLLSEEATHDVD